MIDGTEWVWFSLKLHKRRVLPSSGHHDGQTPVQRADLALMTFSLVLTLKPLRSGHWGANLRPLERKAFCDCEEWTFAAADGGGEKIKQQVHSDPGGTVPWGRLASRRVSGVQLMDDLWVRRDQVLNKHTYITGFMKPPGDWGNGARVTFDRRWCVCVCEWKAMFVHVWRVNGVFVQIVCKHINEFMHWRVHVYVCVFFFFFLWLELPCRLQNVSINWHFGK